MNKKNIISIISFIGVVVIYVMWTTGELDPNKTRINEDVYLVRDNDTFEVYCEQKTTRRRSGINPELIATNVDSIAISYKYGTFFHGTNPDINQEMWFYIDVSTVKNIHTNFMSLKDVASSTMGEAYMDSVKVAEQIWEEYN